MEIQFRGMVLGIGPEISAYCLFPQPYEYGCKQSMYPLTCPFLVEPPREDYIVHD